MKPKIKKMFIDALKSGDYKMGKGKLKQVNSKGEDVFCVLGILTDLYSKHHKGRRGKFIYQSCCSSPGSEPSSGEYSFGGMVEHVHPKVLEWSGLSLFDADTLINLNDNIYCSKKSLKIIAKEVSFY